MRAGSSHKLQAAITIAIEGNNRFNLPKYWGTGDRASVDGTKWDIYENNLLAEYHIRYGGYGGIAYYNHLVANCLIFYNVFEISRILNELRQEGYPLNADAVAAFSPYWTQHVNRFGVYDLNLDRSPPPIAKRATKAVDYDLQVIPDIEPEIPLP